MIGYIIIKHLRVEKANTVAGLTYGFPSVGSFIGFVHALGMNLANHGFEERLTKVSILHHNSKVDKYKPGWDFKFALQRTPIQPNGKPAPFVEEGKMSLDVSLVIRIEEIQTTTNYQKLCMTVRNEILTMKLSGGNIIKVGDGKNGCVFCPNDETMLKSVRQLYPFSAIADRSELYIERIAEIGQKDKLKAFMSFCEVESKYEHDEIGIGEWITIKKHLGYLVPFHYGYKSVGDEFSNGGQVCLRNSKYKAVFVEPVHSIAEWVCSFGKYESYFKDDISKVFWGFHHEGGYYLFNSIKGVIYGK